MILEQEPEEGAPIFVAVHGTWGSRSEWMHKNSAIFKTLLASYPRAGLFRYEWSGTNGTRHRLLAAEILRDNLNTLLATYSASDVVTISHSHGGNVAAWAATDLSRPLFTSIYLNTPFIQVLDSTNLLPIGSDIIIMAFIMGFGYGVLRLLSIVWSSLTTWATTFAALHAKINWILQALAGVTASLIGFIAARRIKPYREKVIQASMRKHKTQVGELVVSMVGDEASLILGTVAVAQWLSRGSFALLYLIYFLLSLTIYFSKWSKSMFEPFEFLFLFVSAAVALVFTLSYGWVQAMICLDSSVTVTASPIGVADCLTVAWNRRDKFRHTTIYESPAAIEKINEWLKSKGLSVLPTRILSDVTVPAPVKPRGTPRRATKK